MLEGVRVAEFSGFSDSFLLFKMIFSALVLFGTSVPFLGGLVLFLGCFEEE